MSFDAGDVIAFLIALGGLYMAWRKAPSEGRVLSADAAAKFQDIAVRAAERLDALESQVRDLEDQLKKAQVQAQQFEDWARRLSYQVKSMGGVPVPIDPATDKASG